MTKMKKVLSLVLAFVMTASLFTNWPMPVFAAGSITESDSTVNLVADNGEAAVTEVTGNTAAYLADDSVTLYEHYAYDAYTVKAKNYAGTPIYLYDKITFAGSDLVLYKYSYNGDESQSDIASAMIKYAYISSDDITFTAPAVTPEPTAEPTPAPTVAPTAEPTSAPTAAPEATAAPGGITLDTVPQGEIPTAKDPAAKYGTVNTDKIKLFKSPDYGAAGVEMDVKAGTMIELVTAYTFENGQIVYRFDYHGVDNSSLFDAALSQYSGTPFIPAEYVTVGIGDLVEKTVTDADTGMSVTTLVPATAELVSELTDVENLPAGTDTSNMGENALFYDLTVANGGAVYKTTQDLTVTFPQANLTMPKGAEYTAFHVTDEGTVENLGTFTYAGGDVAVTVDSLSYVGLSSDVVELYGIPFEKAVFKNTTATVYTGDVDMTPVEITDLTDADILQFIDWNDGSATGFEVEGIKLYYVEKYIGSNTTLDELFNKGSSRVLVALEDIEVYVEPTPTPDAPELEDITLKDEETGIEAYGYLPRGTTMLVKKADISEVNLDEELYPLGDNTIVYDIKLMLDGKEYHPEYPVDLHLPKENIPFRRTSGFTVYHVHDDKTVDAYGPYKYSGGFIDITIEDFSYFVYTDSFPERNTINHKKYFNKSTVTLYSSPLAIAETYTLEEANQGLYTMEYYYIDKDGNKWFAFYNFSFPDFDSTWVYVKEEDTSDLKHLIDHSGIKVAGLSVPDDVTLSVTPKTIEETGLNTDIYTVSENSIFYDVTLLQNGTEYQPADGITVTFPESEISLDIGSYYTVYHIHDGVVETTTPSEYTGGDISADFANLSIVGISESEAPINLEEMYGGAASTSLLPEEKTVYFADENVVLYDSFQNSVYTLTMENYSGIPISIYNEIKFPDGTIFYQFAPLVEIDHEILPLLNTYQFIAASDISETQTITTVDDSLIVDSVSGIEVYGSLPENAVLNVTPVTIDTSTWDNTNYPLGDTVVAYDISLSYGWIKYHPEHPVSVTVPESVLGFDETVGFNMYHTHDDQTTEVFGPYTYSGGFVSLDVEDFSQFVYTDTYQKANTINWKVRFTSSEGTVYSSPLPSAATVTLEDAKESVYIAEYYYVDNSGETWYAIYNDFTELETSYVFVKGSDITTNFSYHNFANAAPLVQPAAASAYNAMAANTFSLVKAADTIRPVPTDADGNGIIVDKYISGKDDDGNYILTLETWTTGAKTTSVGTKEMPADIILVLDQSGSMVDEDNNMTAATVYGDVSGTAKEVYENASYNNNLYYKDGDSYYQVTIEPLDANGVSVTYEPYGNYNNSYFYSQQTNGIWYEYNGEYYQVRVNYSRISGNYYYSFTVGNTTYYITESGVTTDLLSAYRENGRDTPRFANKLLRKHDIAEAAQYKFSYTAANGNLVEVDTYAVAENVPENTYYTVTQQGGEVTRLQALKNALTIFVDSVEEKASGENGVEHTISMVGFAHGTQLNNNYNKRYNNTEVFVGAQQYTYNAGATSNSTQNNNAAQDHYADVPQDMTTTTGVANVRASIEALSGDGATQVDLGIEMANGILAELAKEANRYVDADGKVIRNKIVIVFTDGEPSSFSDYSSTIANAGINNANATKNTYGATVYTVGVFTGANGSNPGSLPGDNDTNNNRENRFMHLVSSNYPSATSMTATGTLNSELGADESYYLSASDASTLNNIFQQISNNIESGGSTTTLTEETEIRDLVTRDFKLPDNADKSNIKVYTAPYTAENTFGAWTKFADAEIAVNETDKSITVSNFNFMDNWVGTETTQTSTGSSVVYRGNKLIIEIPIIPEPFFLGGNQVETNLPTSGIYTDSNDTTAEETFPVPDADIALLPITINWNDQHIYLTNAADIGELFKNATVTGRNDATKPLPDVFNSSNNGYVDTVFTITEAGTTNVIGTYTIPAGKTFEEGDWESDKNLYPVLSDDKSYEINWTMTPITEGTVQPYDTSTDEEHTDAIATVYVYDPIITFNDSEDWLGDALTHGVGVNYTAGAEVWKNPTTGKLSSEVTMHGDKPTVAITCQTAAELTGNDNGIITSADDIPVQATVKITNENGVETNAVENTHYTVVHSTCSHAGCTYPASGEEFIVHVLSGTLEVSKTVNKVNGQSGPLSEFEFTVFNGLGYEMSITINGETKDITSGGTFKLTDGQKAVITGLPKSTYSVEETEYPAYKTTVNGSDGRTANGSIASTDTVEVSFTNEPKTGHLTIGKVVDKAYDKDTLPGDTFTFTVDIYGTDTSKEYTYTKSDNTTGTIKDGGTVTLKAGQTVTISDLPLGAFTVVESKDVDYTTSVTKGTQGEDAWTATGTIAAAETDEVEFTNTYTKHLGNLTVNKNVVTLPNFTVPGDTFKFTVTGPNGYSTTFDLADGGTNTLYDLPLGQYTVTETANDKYTTTVNGTAGYSITVDVTATGATVNYENTQKSVGLEITKTVEAPTGITHPDFEFAIEVPGVVNINALKYTVDGVEKQVSNGKITLAAGKKAVFTGLPAGAKVTITETENADYIPTPANRVVEVTLPNSGNGTAAFKNTLKTSTLEISKVIADPDGYTVPKTDKFEFTVNLGIEGNYSYTLTSGTTTSTGTIANGGKLTLGHNDKVVISGLPVGTTYEVVETADADYTTTMTGDTGTIKADTTVKAVFTNTLNTGKLTIRKDVVAVNNVDLTTENFTFNVTVNGNGSSDYIITHKDNTTSTGTITFTNGVGTITLKDGDSVEFAKVPAGAYKVEETDGQDNKYTYDCEATGYTGAIEAGKTATAAFTNTMKSGSLTVTKHVAVKEKLNKPDVGFEFTVKVTDAKQLIYTIGAGAAVTVNGDTATFTLKDGETATFSEIFAGAEYTVTEAENTDYTTTMTGDKGTITANATAEAVFTNTLNTGLLEISKTVTGVDGFAIPDTEFQFNVTINGTGTLPVTITHIDNTTSTSTMTFVASPDDATKGVATINLKHGEKAVIANVPVGKYTVTETYDSAYYSSEVTDNYKGTILANTKASVAFVNTLKNGTLTVTKVVEAVSGFSIPEDEDFTFTLTTKGTGTATYTHTDAKGNVTEKTVTYTGGVATFTLKHGEKAVFNVPLGTEYTVAETVPPQYTVNNETVTGTIPVDTGKAKAEFVNTMKAGALTITKTVTGVSTPSADDVFVFNVTGTTFYGEAVNVEVTLPAADFNGATASTVINNLPYGTYTVTENTAASWRYTLTSANNVEVVVDSTAENAAFTNNLTNNKWLDVTTSAENIFVKGENGTTITRQ